ncbi:hypothetical protein [Streptomyces collinus]
MAARLAPTEKISRELLSLPFHQHLTENDIDQVVTLLGQAPSCARS